MRYTHDLIVPPGYTSAEPYGEEVVLSYGLLERVLVRFRDGCHNVVFVSITDSLFQLVPSTPDSYLYGNDQIFEIPMQYTLTTKPYTLNLWAWSPLAQFSHNITFWFDIDQTYTPEQSSLLDQLLHLGEQT